MPFTRSHQYILGYMSLSIHNDSTLHITFFNAKLVSQSWNLAKLITKASKPLPEYHIWLVKRGKRT